jgi:hypothetical protein
MLNQDKKNRFCIDIDGKHNFNNDRAAPLVLVVESDWGYATPIGQGEIANP